MKEVVSLLIGNTILYAGGSSVVPVYAEDLNLQAVYAKDLALRTVCAEDLDLQIVWVLGELCLGTCSRLGVIE